MDRRSYFTDCGHESGLMPVGKFWFTIGVCDESGRRCGEAHPKRPILTATGPLASFELIVDKVPLPGRWAVLDRQFVPASWWEDDRQGDA